MAGFENDVVFALNGDFSQADNQAPVEANGLVTDGQLWIGSTALNAGSTHINVGTITSTSLTVGYSSPDITIEFPGGGSAIEQITVDNSTLPGTNPVLPLAGNVTITGGQVVNSALANVIQTHALAANSFAVTIQRAGSAGAANTALNGVAHFDSSDFTVAATGFVSLANADLHAARYIVSAGGAADGANYTTIATAYAAAVLAGGAQTVFVQPGTYTENLTLSPNVNIAAFVGDSFTPTVTIVGKITSTITGTCSLSNIRLQTNGDYLFECTGANVGVINLMGCYLNATNANAINWTNANSVLQIINCFGDCAANTYFISTGGAIKCFHSNLASSTGTTVNSTFANSNFEAQYSYISCPFTTSGTATFGLVMSQLVCTNTTALTHGGSGSSTVLNSRIEAGTGSAISIGAAATLPVINTAIDSTNANAITGAGILKYGIIVFTNSSSTVNTSTQTALATMI